MEIAQLPVQADLQQTIAGGNLSASTGDLS